MHLNWALLGVRLYLKVSSEVIESDIANQDIEFKCIPAYSPHFGGIWEAAIKSMKHLLRRVMSLTHLTYEEFAKCPAKVQAILNSRPLTPLSTDRSDLTCHTPLHLVLGRALRQFLDQTSVTLTHRDCHASTVSRS
ncbi:unnamed protein product [Arctia plantaginis]|uniref:Uncharacterized protein n=1 Tax=Arctia plantaginis TaxID=874455 RepID=A0A8S1A049_ARCPL|nr:unnamed protein product [Arctia plantaginis]